MCVLPNVGFYKFFSLPTKTLRKDPEKGNKNKKAKDKSQQSYSLVEKESLSSFFEQFSFKQSFKKVMDDDKMLSFLLANKDRIVVRG